MREAMNHVLLVLSGDISQSQSYGEKELLLPLLHLFRELLTMVSPVSGHVTQQYICHMTSEESLCVCVCVCVCVFVWCLWALNWFSLEPVEKPIKVALSLYLTHLMELEVVSVADHPSCLLASAWLCCG